jgi:hypothetical protein
MRIRRRLRPIGGVAVRIVTLAVSIGLCSLPSLARAQDQGKVHELHASPTTVHRGFFDGALKPVLTVDSGDIVRLETASGNPRYFEQLGVPKERIPKELYPVFEGVSSPWGYIPTSTKP